MGGMVLETNMSEILLRIQEQEKIKKEEVFTFYLTFCFHSLKMSIETVSACMFFKISLDKLRIFLDFRFQL